ncbi:MAG: HyaD/HybD family hydrogenase maturation endopeptidase [Sulfuricella sp.]
MRIVVLGVGNILLSDEGIGVRTVEKLARDYVLPPEVEVIDGGTSAMEMLEDLGHADHLIIVDAVRSGKAPATIIRMAGDEVPVFFRTKLSPHQVGLSDVLATLVLMGEQPGTTTVIGIEPESLALGLELTPAVAMQLPQVVGLVKNELNQLGMNLTARH